MHVRQCDVRDTRFASRLPESTPTFITSAPTSRHIHAPALPVQPWSCVLAPPPGTSGFAASRDGARHGVLVSCDVDDADLESSIDPDAQDCSTPTQSLIPPSSFILTHHLHRQGGISLQAYCARSGVGTVGAAPRCVFLNSHPHQRPRDDGRPALSSSVGNVNVDTVGRQSNVEDVRELAGDAGFAAANIRRGRQQGRGQ
ncbi:hypothetical protein AB1N83_013177 [Pleurotus pulmonarius]